MKEDIIVNEKFVEKNLEKHEAIGGKNIFVLLDTRQDENLKVKGFAREFINKIQRLKKKAKINPEDNILIFFKLGDNAKMLTQALEKERKMIELAVKKPLVPVAEYTEQVVITREEGEVDKEQYEFFFTRESPIVNFAELKASFGESAQVLQRVLISTPYAKVVEDSKTGKLTVTLDGNQVELEVNKHFRLLF